MNTTAHTARPGFEIKTVETTVENVRKGDIIGGATAGWKVETVKVGTKWVELRDADGKLIVRTEVGAQIDVEREIETEESIKARETARATKQLQEMVDGSQADVDRALKSYTEYVTNNPFNISDPSGVMMAQASHHELQRIASILDGNDKASTLLEAAEIWKRQTVKDLTGRFSTRALSRSTSVMSNLSEDIEREAKLILLDKLEWLGL